MSAPADERLQSHSEPMFDTDTSRNTMHRIDGNNILPSHEQQTLCDISQNMPTWSRYVNGGSQPNPSNQPPGALPQQVFHSGPPQTQNSLQSQQGTSSQNNSGQNGQNRDCYGKDETRMSGGSSGQGRNSAVHQLVMELEQAAIIDPTIVTRMLKIVRQETVRPPQRGNYDNSRRPVMNKMQSGPPGANIFVFHVPNHWTESELTDHFGEFGELVSARIQRDTEGRTRGFAFVSYTQPQQAASAIHHMHGKSVDGKFLKVQLKRGEEQYLQMIDGGYTHNNMSSFPIPMHVMHSMPAPYLSSALGSLQGPGMQRPGGGHMSGPGASHMTHGMNGSPMLMPSQNHGVPMHGGVGSGMGMNIGNNDQVAPVSMRNHGIQGGYTQF